MAGNGDVADVKMSVGKENNKLSAVDATRERLLKWQQERGRIRSNRLPWEPMWPKKKLTTDGNNNNAEVKENENPNSINEKKPPNKPSNSNSSKKYLRDRTVSAPPGNKRVLGDMDLPLSAVKRSKTDADALLLKEMPESIQELAAELEKLKVPRYKTEHWRAARRAHYSERIRQMMNRRHTFSASDKQRVFNENCPKSTVKKNVRNKQVADLKLNRKEDVKTSVSVSQQASVSRVKSFDSSIKIKNSNSTNLLARSRSASSAVNHLASSSIATNTIKDRMQKSLPKSKNPLLKPKSPPKPKLKSPKLFKQKKFNMVASRYLQPKASAACKKTEAVSTNQINNPQPKRKPLIVGSKSKKIEKPLNIPSKFSLNAVAERVMAFKRQKNGSKVKADVDVIKEESNEVNADVDIVQEAAVLKNDCSFPEENSEVSELNKTFEKEDSLNRTFEKEKLSNKVSFYIPFEKTPKHKSLKNIKAKSLDHRRTISHFRHEDDPSPKINKRLLRRSVDHSTPKKQMKYLQFCNRTEPRRRSEFNTQTKHAIDEKLNKMDDDEETILKKLLMLLDDNHPYEEISEKLDSLCENKPEIRKMAKYWICRAQVAVVSDNLNEAFRLFQLAVDHNAEPLQELRDCFEKLKQKIDIESSLPFNNGELNDLHGSSSSVMQLFVTTPYKRISDFKMYSVTPVRRSIRHSARHSVRHLQADNEINVDTCLPMCVETLEDIPSDVRRSLLFKPNPALNDWEC